MLPLHSNKPSSSGNGSTSGTHAALRRTSITSGGGGLSGCMSSGRRSPFALISMLMVGLVIGYTAGSMNGAAMRSANGLQGIKWRPWIIRENSTMEAARRCPPCSCGGAATARTARDHDHDRDHDDEDDHEDDARDANRKANNGGAIWSSISSDSDRKHTHNARRAHRTERCEKLEPPDFLNGRVEVPTYVDDMFSVTEVGANAHGHKIDPNGYVFPCMFGEGIASYVHVLIETLQMAVQLNRTYVVPCVGSSSHVTGCPPPPSGNMTEAQWHAYMYKTTNLPLSLFFDFSLILKFYPKIITHAQYFRTIPQSQWPDCHCNTSLPRCSLVPRNKVPSTLEMLTQWVKQHPSPTNTLALKTVYKWEYKIDEAVKRNFFDNYLRFHSAHERAVDQFAEKYFGGWHVSIFHWRSETCKGKNVSYCSDELAASIVALRDQFGPCGGILLATDMDFVPENMIGNRTSIRKALPPARWNFGHRTDDARLRALHKVIRAGGGRLAKLDMYFKFSNAGLSSIYDFLALVKSHHAVICSQGKTCRMCNYVGNTMKWIIAARARGGKDYDKSWEVHSHVGHDHHHDEHGPGFEHREADPTAKPGSGEELFFTTTKNRK
eukprot:TRINITY_DN66434_c11_g2_i1.p1 TRINITY_DN66434_c11_g2~~TRINITY_DN66434_c11_g2_i1.p1  ORF type:complete len:608 (+),score=212.02 TRINITY_DN66434_c11_g2_i1:99-1922(+)